jgi:predicted AAA+ superfamily ATPase
MIKRELAQKLLALAKQFPSLAILGPRQSGKTTLAQATFPTYKYFSLEDFDTRALIESDPKAFLEKYKDEAGIILDEIQNLPQLFSYLQVHIDAYKKKGHFIVTGSQNFALNEAISQSLAGRIAILTLLPLSIAELKQSSLLPNDIDRCLFNGMYPSIYADGIDPHDWYRSYTATYVERDVRQIKNVQDLSTFQNFMKLCAGRIGQLLNLTSLSDDSGMSVTTITQWITILEASYIVFLLQPYYRNLGNRVIKSPKLFFYDTGLACNLLGITSSDQLFSHYLRGNLFESFIISDLIKQRQNKGMNPNIYFWRDKTQFEVDAIIENGETLTPIETKVSQTFNPHHFEYLSKWNELTQTNPDNNILVYGGTMSQDTKNGRLISWKDIENLN